jgi:hypothetical protein
MKLNGHPSVLRSLYDALFGEITSVFMSSLKILRIVPQGALNFSGHFY